LKICSIHCQPRIGWQGPFALKMREGLAKIGIHATITDSRLRAGLGFPILLGTSNWRGIESQGEYLLVDRCSFGDTERYVSLVWNGHGRRGDHRIPVSPCPSRWEGMGIDLVPWRQRGSRVVLCGQTESYSPHWPRIEDWYKTVPATHFRPHPAGSSPNLLPTAFDFSDCKAAVVLNSSVAVKAVMAGVPTITMDEGSMAWDVTGHSLDDIRMPDRRPWAIHLAWTQWSHDEIREGKPIAHLFEGI
jgi:hypothetical protein